MPHRCIGSTESVLRMRRSSVPWSRSTVDRGTAAPVDSRQLYAMRPVDCQEEAWRNGKDDGFRNTECRVCIEASRFMLSRGCGGCDGNGRIAPRAENAPPQEQKAFAFFLREESSRLLEGSARSVVIRLIRVST